MRILIIDDEEVLRDVLEAVLQREGFDVALAATAEEGLAIVENEDIDLVVLDMMLPGMDGHEARRSRRSRRKSKHFWGKTIWTRRQNLLWYMISYPIFP